MYALVVIYVINHMPYANPVIVFTDTGGCEAVKQTAMDYVLQKHPDSKAWASCQPVAVFDKNGKVHDTTSSEL